MRRIALALAGLAAACASHGPETSETGRNWRTLDGEAPIVIGHRGASGMRPEHTLAAYDLAITQGADFIEPDLVMTADGVLVCRHDRYLSTTTDVSDRPDFADRRRAANTVDGPREDWWVEDFTLGELRTLRARQPFPGRSPDYDGQELIPTFEEVVELVQRRSAELGRTIGIYPETKSPTYFSGIGLDMTEPLIEALEAAGWTAADAPVFIQSFEPEILRTLDARIETPLVQLVYVDPTSADGAPPRPNIALDEVVDFVDGVGAQKTLIIDDAGEPTGFVAQAHAHGLVVHAWTFRDDQPPPDGAAIEAELERIFAMGVDGVFSDFPATALRVRDRR